MPIIKHINRPYVYLITDGRYYKIGSSMNPHRRVKQLSTGNAKCVLLGYTKRFDEKKLHKKYKKWKVKGEWFNLPQYEADNLLAEMRVVPKKFAKKEYDYTLENYIIKFGKHKGTPLMEMVTYEQIKYIRHTMIQLPRGSYDRIMFESWNNYYIFHGLYAKYNE